MKATIIIGVFLCVAVVVLSRRPDPTLQPYPVVFTAVYNESDRVNYWQAPRMNTAYLDVPNKRASVSYASDSGKTESWALIYQPKGADPTSPVSKGYTAFNINPDYPAKVPNNCFYTMAGSVMSLAPFPPHWSRNEYPYSQEVDTWYDLPSDLVYAGQYFIAELGVTSDRWDTATQCRLEKSGIGQVPCASVMYSQGQNPLPLMDIRAFGARKNSFENDMYAIRVYHSFTTSVQDSDFALPNNWQVSCGNADNGFVNSPDMGIMVYSNGDADSLTIKLATPPIPSLGDVKLFFTPTPSWYYNCVDCISFGVDHLTFTRDNWNVSQPWPMKYVHNGCSQYSIGATGGGYDWVYYGRTVTIYGCESNESGGCVTQPKCGDT